MYPGDENNYYQECYAKGKAMASDDVKKELLAINKKIADRETKYDIEKTETRKLRTQYHAMLDSLRA